MQKRPDPREIRLNNLIAAASHYQSRIREGAQFASDENVKEIGLLTMYFAELEESIAFYCEILLLRPELGGFHQPRPVGEKRFGEKLDLCKTLTIALGVLRTIGTDAIMNGIDQARAIGEKRNSIIHGYLHLAPGSTGLVFRNKQNEVQANLTSLRKLNSEVLQANESIAQVFGTFFQQLVNAAPGQPDLDTPIITALESKLKYLRSTIKLRNSKAALVDAKAVLVNSKRKARNSRERLRRAELKLPPEYRDLLMKRRLQLKRCTALTSRIEATGTEDPELKVENVKLKEIDNQLKALRIALLRDEHERNG